MHADIALTDMMWLLLERNGLSQNTRDWTCQPHKFTSWILCFTRLLILYDNSSLHSSNKIMFLLLYFRFLLHILQSLLCT